MKDDSPGQSLRDRIKARLASQPAMDPEFMRFWARLNKLAKIHYAGRAEGEDAEAMAREIYAEYRAAAGADLDDWLIARLKGVFASVYELPVWLGPEPEWPYLGGRPMVFISQTPLAGNAVTTERLGWEMTVYLFGARVPKGDGFTLEYRVVQQHNEQTEEQHLRGEMPQPLRRE